jgi:hypothetical protein
MLKLTEVWWEHETRKTRPIWVRPGAIIHMRTGSVEGETTILRFEGGGCHVTETPEQIIELLASEGSEDDAEKKFTLLQPSMTGPHR